MSTHDLIDDTTWTEGDFEIITADNVRLKTKEHILLWAV